MGRRLLAMTMTLLAVSCSSKAATSARQASRTASSFEAPSSSSSTTSTEANHVASDATALARRIGCVHIDTLTDVPVGNLPKPTRSVGCTIGGVDITIDVYASHGDVVQGTDAAGRIAVCALASAFGFHTLYSVIGYDFTAQAQTQGSSQHTLAEAQALGKAVGLPVTTIHC